MSQDAKRRVGARGLQEQQDSPAVRVPSRGAAKLRNRNSTAGEATLGPAELRPVLTNHQFFNRLAEAFIAEVSRP